MGANVIADTLKALAPQFATVLPSIMFVLINVNVILPNLFPDIDSSAPLAVALIIWLIFMLSYLLYAFNSPLIRLFQGYPLARFSVGRWLIHNKKQWYKYLMKEIGRLEWTRLQLDNRLYDPATRAADPEWQTVCLELARLRHRIEVDYPSDATTILPTILGNIIAAFEEYPRARYGIEPVVLWPRLVHLLKESNYLEMVAQEKAVFDFLLNTCAVTAVLGLEVTCLGLFQDSVGSSLMSLALTLVIALGFYEGMLMAARQWGLTFRAAFDLHRYQLHNRLGLRAEQHESVDDETRRWQLISGFLLYNWPTRRDFPHFLTQAEFDEKADTGRDKK